jgi:hypothetical protein
MKKIIKLFSLLFLITITFIGCKSSDESNKQKVAKEFGRNLYTVDAQKIAVCNKMINERENFLLGKSVVVDFDLVSQDTPEFSKTMISLDKNIKSLMTKKGYENIVASRFNTIGAEVCTKGKYSLQATDFILEDNLYTDKEDKAGYYYEAKLKFISTNGKAERTDTAKGYIGLLKENGQWRVFYHEIQTYPKLYEEFLTSKL